MKGDLLTGVYGANYIMPSKIQIKCIPSMILGKNIIAQSQNGSGKTATFSIGVLSKIDRELPSSQALILSPTRELAIQNCRVLEMLAKPKGSISSLIIPQADFTNPFKQVLVGTPGKFAELIQKRKLNLSDIKVFVLDEADVMIAQSQGMGQQVRNIYRACPRECQYLFFSATFPPQVRAFANQMAPNAEHVAVEKQDLTVAIINQIQIECNSEPHKYEMLQNLYEAMEVGSAIIFVNRKTTAFDVAKKLENDGHTVSLICGTTDNGERQMDPGKRDRIMEEFRQGKTKVLIATDVLSRGIDIPQVTLVVNYELPFSSQSADKKVDFETYLHRIGRTGRFGLAGVACSLTVPTEEHYIESIRTTYECTITKYNPAESDLCEMIKNCRPTPTTF